MIDYIPSPNCNDRPDPEDISLIVIHNISLPPGQFDGDAVIKFFTNQLDFSSHPYYQKIKDMKVSSHLFLRRNGSWIQFVPFAKRAWHAGESSWEGRANCNDYSIGIELEGTDSEFYTDEQYEQLRIMLVKLRVQYPKITPDRIVGHSDIAPARKTDPGSSFDWARIRQ